MRLYLRDGARYNNAIDAAYETIWCGLSGLGPSSDAGQDLFEQAFDESMKVLEYNAPHLLDVITRQVVYARR